jgi:hypothetical protein
MGSGLKGSAEITGRSEAMSRARIFMEVSE